MTNWVAKLHHPSQHAEELQQPRFSGFKPSFAESKIVLTLGSALQSSPRLCNGVKLVLWLWHVNKKSRVCLQTSQVK